jgi:hypothetical protein
MQILKSLRNRFEGLTAWQPGYAPMVQTLHSRGGYAAPKAGEDPAQVDPGLTGCVYADNNLLPAVREYGQIDQESIL